MSATRFKIVLTLTAMLVLLFSSSSTTATAGGVGKSVGSTEYRDIPCCKKP